MFVAILLRNKKSPEFSGLLVEIDSFLVVKFTMLTING